MLLTFERCASQIDLVFVLLTTLPYAVMITAPTLGVGPWVCPTTPSPMALSEDINRA